MKSILKNYVGVDSILDSSFVSAGVSVIEGTVGEGDSLSRLMCFTFFEDDDDDDDEVEEWDPGDVVTFGLVLGVSSVVVFGDVCSVFGTFNGGGGGSEGGLDVLFIEEIAARSRSMICSCCWRNELRKCSRCIKTAVIADESRLGNMFDEPLLRNVVGSRFPGK